MPSHDDNFKQGADDLDAANDALDDGNYIKATAYAVKGIGQPIISVVKDPVGFAKELIGDLFR